MNDASESNGGVRLHRQAYLVSDLRDVATDGHRHPQRAARVARRAVAADLDVEYEVVTVEHATGDHAPHVACCVESQRLGTDRDDTIAEHAGHVPPEEAGDERVG